LSGTFTVANELDPHADTASFQLVPRFQSPVTASLVVNHTSYKPGQTIRLVMTLENTSKAKIAVASKPKINGITVVQGSTVVFRSGAIASPLAAKNIKPDGSVKLALAWSGRPNQQGI